MGFFLLHHGRAGTFCVTIIVLLWGSGNSFITDITGAAAFKFPRRHSPTQLRHSNYENNVVHRRCSFVDQKPSRPWCLFAGTPKDEYDPSSKDGEGRGEALVEGSLKSLEEEDQLTKVVDFKSRIDSGDDDDYEMQDPTMADVMGLSTGSYVLIGITVMMLALNQLLGLGWAARILDGEVPSAQSQSYSQQLSSKGYTMKLNNPENLLR